MNDAATTLTDAEATLLESIKCECGEGLVRKLMDKQEIRDVKQLVALGLVFKGTTTDKYHSVAFYSYDAYRSPKDESRGW